MIFALWDYWRYAKRQGRYSDTQSDVGMANGFTDSIPPSEIDHFQIGDLIFTQRLNSRFSWATMYVTASPVDHTAIYAGGGMVAHMTLTGAKTHSLRALSSGSRLIILRMTKHQMLEWTKEFEKIKVNIDKGTAFQHAFPPKIQLFIGGIWCAHGKYPRRFCWKVFIDFFIFITLISTSISYIFNVYLPLAIPIISIIYLVYNKISNMIRSLKKLGPRIMSHPDIGYHLFYKVGGLAFTRIGPLVFGDFGIIPLKIVLGFIRQRPDHSADNKLNEAYEFFGDLIEDLNIKVIPKKTEY